jgi:hypothetical protein
MVDWSNSSKKKEKKKNVTFKWFFGWRSLIPPGIVFIKHQLKDKPSKI